MPQASPQHAGAVPAPLSHVSGVLGATSSALPWAMWVSLAGGTDGRGGGGACRQVAACAGSAGRLSQMFNGIL